ncbi:Zinc finger CCHC domain-containing protein 8 like protein [Habropoda laboriosa]|uniref:Zinc finger CCHC domain-containing protein 8 like protein n=1 Tax=Habropoda laboriosa TaxID=597456 RepID=A0A0L7R8I6_9HYME|nr:Zinc finger CCHC domain-containing protein 8 like protein [Habropoda laboriosa]
MNSTITIEDTDEEVIDLDSSQDNIVDTDNDQSECSIEKNSLSNNNASKTDIASENVESNSSTFKAEICDNTSTSKPLFKVIFRDENVSGHYSKRIKEFLEELVSSKIKSQENDNGLTLEIWDNDTDSTSQSIEITTKSDDSQDIICETLFTVDTQPKLKDDFDVPTYGKKYENVYDKTKSESDPKQNDGYAPKLMCFNCSENHNLRDCPHPRNQANIEKNRKNLKGNLKTLRYHLEDDQKFGHMIPGQLSNNLRRALGWLEEARLQHSGLTLFNSDGVAEGDPNDEPGVVFEAGDKDQYDVKKIYDFPGFNVPPPPGTRDECGQYWVSNMQDVNSKQRMLLLLNEKKADDGYKRKKLKICNSATKDSAAPVPSEMEIDDAEEGMVESIPINGLFVPPLPPESVVRPPEPSDPPLPVTISEDSHSQELPFSESLEDSASPSSRANSPSLSELENIKKRLLVELQESNSNSDVSSKSNLSNSVPKSDMPPFNTETTPESNRIQQNEANTSCGSIKSVDLGTPVLQSTSPYSKLPSSDKFSKNICDIINFENLPDSTGKYKQMTGVLRKVRNTMAKLQQE